MTPAGAPLLSWGWLSHSDAESEHVLLLSARPILDRLGDVRGLDPVRSCQVGDGTSQLQHAMIRPRAQVHLPHGCAEELAAGLVHRAVIAHLGRAHVGVGGQPGALTVLDVGKPRSLPRSRRLDPRPDRGRRLAATLVVDVIDESFWNGTRGTSTWMSMRSSSGLERRFW